MPYCKAVEIPYVSFLEYILYPFKMLPQYQVHCEIKTSSVSNSTIKKKKKIVYSKELQNFLSQKFDNETLYDAKAVDIEIPFKSQTLITCLQWAKVWEVSRTFLLITWGLLAVFNIIILYCLQCNLGQLWRSEQGYSYDIYQENIKYKASPSSRSMVHQLGNSFAGHTFPSSVFLKINS